MSFGVTTNGFVVKRLADIREELDNKIKSVFGNQVNLDERAPFGQLRDIFGEREAKIWELAEEVYNSQYPNSAEGTNLDNVVSITGTERNPPTKSTVALLFKGTTGTAIAIGTIVSREDDPDIKFVTLAAAVVAAGTNEVQGISFGAVPSGGSFTLAFDGDTTAAINFNATSGDVKTALENLVNIDLVAVSGDFANDFSTEFQGNNAEMDVSLLEVVTNLLESKEKSSIQCVADVSESLDRKYILLQDGAGSVAFWIDVDDSGSSIPAGAAGADRAVEVTTIAENDSANDVATKMFAAIDADSEFDCSNLVGDTFEVESNSAGERTDFADGDSTFTFTKLNEGYSAGNLPVTITESTKGVEPQISVNAEAQNPGALAAPSESLTVIETPIANIDSVSNPLDAVIGEDLESDPDLLIRRNEELATAGRATTDAIRARVLKVTGVTAVIVFENDDNIEDSEGRPPNSVQVVAQGGTDQDVALGIHDAVAAGIKTFGSTNEPITTDQGFAKTINFDRPTERDVWVEFDLTTDPNFFPADGDDQVAAAILAYGNNQNIGQDLVVRGTSSLICVADGIPGITNIAVRVGFSASPTSDANLAIAANEIANFDSSRISVTVL